jgi:imidazolonepropionase-like amidohydrolase
MTRTIFTNCNLFSGEGTPKPNSSVAIEGERIVAVATGELLAGAPGDRMLDLGGATLMPGMVQAHWHGSYEGLDFGCPPVGLERPPGYLMLLAAKHARLALDHGFTSLIGAATSDAIDAQLDSAIQDGVLMGPRIVACGRWLITTGDSNDLPEYWWWQIGSPGAQQICDGADEFRKGARREIKEGAEIVKIFSDGGHALLYGSEFTAMTDAELHAVVEAVHHRGKKVRSHVTAKPNILACIEAGVDILDHADGMDDESIDAMVSAGSLVCPSLYLSKAILARLESEGGGDEPLAVTLRHDFEHICSVLPRANLAGVKLLVGDDWGTAMTPHGDYIKEMQLYVEQAGIAAADVLRWATKNGAEAMGQGSELGTIEAGKLADLLVVSGDPTREIALLGDTDNLLAIVKGGVFVKDSLMHAT